jgi:hypothetical protein
MKSKRLFPLILAIFVALGGCSPTFTPTLAPSATPDCSLVGLKAVSLIGPDGWEVLESLSPTLNWSYPDPACSPEGYAIHLYAVPNYTDDLGGGTGNPSTSWGPGSPLLPGKEYNWGVQAVNGTTPGPIEDSAFFFTGPLCGNAALSAPGLLEPADKAIVTTPSPELYWQYPAPCLPLGYQIDLSTDINFADNHLGGTRSIPSGLWGPGASTTDCTIYYWRVAATIGTYMGRDTGLDFGTPIPGAPLGPYSPIFSFTTNFTGVCPSVSPTPSALVTTSPPKPTYMVVLTPDLAVPVHFIPTTNAYCRSGPGMNFSSIGLAMKGQSYLMDGQNQAHTWYRIMLTAYAGCWVLTGAGMPDGDLSGLRVLSDVPTPIPTAVDCSQYTSQDTCQAQTACQWGIAHSGAVSCEPR